MLRCSRKTKFTGHGFTLLELIISVALVLILMLAVTRIFTITSDAVGASQGLNIATRDARGAQAVFARDIGALASDSPFIWIKSTGTFAAFRNADDEKADLDKLPRTLDVNGDGLEGDTNIAGEVVGATTINSRNHRLDQFSFCARDRFVRQTGNAAQNILVSSQASAEAWIYYGPLCLANNDGTFTLTGKTDSTDPGAGENLSENPNNYYASQWVFGRFAPLMVQPVVTGTNQEIKYDKTPQEFFARNGIRMSPFTSVATSIVPPGPPVKQRTLETARYDLIGLDMATARDLVEGDDNWFEYVMTNPLKVGRRAALEINPFVTKPITSTTVAQQMPIFASGVSQFVVEFAGDFMNQNPITGEFISEIPDGEIDFAVVRGARQIRWYGYPRDIDGDGEVNTNPANGTNEVGPDVAPVSDVATPKDGSMPYSLSPYAWFERVSSTTGTTSKVYPADVVPKFGTYYAAFGPDTGTTDTKKPRPRMYRIVMTIDRPEMAGRTADGSTFEFVFSAP